MWSLIPSEQLAKEARHDSRPQRGTRSKAVAAAGAGAAMHGQELLDCGWDRAEEERFLASISINGRNFELVAKAVGSRTLAQTVEYYYKRFKHSAQYWQWKQIFLLHKCGDPLNSDLCFMCKLEGELLCCDTCARSFHLSCLQLQQVPLDEWYCKKCSSNFKPEELPIRAATRAAAAAAAAAAAEVAEAEAAEAEQNESSDDDYEAPASPRHQRCKRTPGCLKAHKHMGICAKPAGCLKHPKQKRRPAIPLCRRCHLHPKRKGFYGFCSQKCRESKKSTKSKRQGSSGLAIANGSAFGHGYEGSLSPGGAAAWSSYCGNPCMKTGGCTKQRDHLDECTQPPATELAFLLRREKAPGQNRSARNAPLQQWIHHLRQPNAGGGGSSSTGGSLVTSDSVAHQLAGLNALYDEGMVDESTYCSSVRAIMPAGTSPGAVRDDDEEDEDEEQEQEQQEDEEKEEEDGAEEDACATHELGADATVGTIYTTTRSGRQSSQPARFDAVPASQGAHGDGVDGIGLYSAEQEYKERMNVKELGDGVDARHSDSSVVCTGSDDEIEQDQSVEEQEIKVHATLCRRCHLHPKRKGFYGFCSQECRENGKKSSSAGNSRLVGTKRKSPQSTRPMKAEDAHNSQCQACGKGGKLICCDGCTLVYHLKCLSWTARPLADAYLDVWHCPVCEGDHA
jgi:hypothetical protein